MTDNTYNFLLKSQWWSVRKISRYQNRELKKLIEHAYKNVPYYKTIMDELGLKPNNIRKTSDLSRLPFLTKDAIISYSNELLATNINTDEIRQVTTGGTTGTPIKIFRNRVLEDPKEKDFIFHAWSRFGINLDDKGTVLTGNRFAGKFENHRFKESKELLFFSCPTIPTNKDWQDLYNKLLEFKPAYLRGYPSIITMFSRYLIENNISAPPSIRAVFYSSENLYDWQQEYIMNAFKIRPIGLYGQSERTVMATGCEYSSEYHVMPEYGFIELVDENDNLITEPNQTGEIVATSFINYAMPFIRYKTGDLAHYSINKCKCGRNHIVLPKIDGRTREFVIDKNNNKILFGPSIYGDLWKHDNLFKQVQFIQNEIGHLNIKVVPTAPKDIIEKQFTETLTKSLGTSISIKILIEEKIERTTSGKQPLFVQNIKEV